MLNIKVELWLPNSKTWIFAASAHTVDEAKELAERIVTATPERDYARVTNNGNAVAYYPNNPEE